MNRDPKQPAMHAMPPKLSVALLLLSGLVWHASAAAMAEPRRDQPPAAQSQPRDTPPTKDCTRYNGTFGFYGNPWCTPEEQARWDRWETRRFTGR